MTKNPMHYIVCESADGWSLHAPGSTDSAIANGDAPALVSGPWDSDEHTIPAWAYSLAAMAPVYDGTEDEQAEYHATTGRDPQIIGWTVTHAGKVNCSLEPDHDTAREDLAATLKAESGK